MFAMPSVTKMETSPEAGVHSSDRLSICLSVCLSHAFSSIRCVLNLETVDYMVYGWLMALRPVAGLSRFNSTSVGLGSKR